MRRKKGKKEIEWGQGTEKLESMIVGGDETKRKGDSKTGKES